MEKMTIDGITYNIGDVLKCVDGEVAKKGSICILKNIYKQNGDIFFDVELNIDGEIKNTGGYYYWRFEHYKKTNIVNY